MIIVEKTTDSNSMSEDLVTSHERLRYGTGTNMPIAPVDGRTWRRTAGGKVLQPDLSVGMIRSKLQEEDGFISILQ
jgi:hypothetical protein